MPVFHSFPTKSEVFPNFMMSQYPEQGSVSINRIAANFVANQWPCLMDTPLIGLNLGAAVRNSLYLC